MKKGKELYMYILGGVIVLAFFVMLYLLILNTVPQANESLLNITVGALIGSFTTVVGYFYGSSKGSADKTEHLTKNNG